MAASVIGLALLFFLGHALRQFFLKTKIPDLLFLILLGYFIGPVFGILRAEQVGKIGGILTTVALVVILYEGGLELRGKQLLKNGSHAVALAVCNFLFAFGVAFGLSHYAFKMELFSSLLLGLSLGCTSAAIVMPMVRVLSLSSRSKTILSLESAVTDVLAIVTVLVLLDAMAGGEFDASRIVIGIGPDTLKSALLGLFLGFAWAVLRKKFPNVTSVSFSGEAWALFSYGVVELLHLNGAITVLSVGFMLSNLDLLPEWAKPLCIRRPVSPEDLGLLQELSLLLRTFFFVYLGMLIEFSDPRLIGLAASIVGAIFILRFIAVRIVLRPSKFSRMDALITTAMGPRGLASAVLASLPLQKGIQGGVWVQQTIFAAIPLSIIATAILVGLTENWGLDSKTGWLYGKYRTR